MYVYIFLFLEMDGAVDLIIKLDGITEIVRFLSADYEPRVQLEG
jgi:hypothetical protein